MTLPTEIDVINEELIRVKERRDHWHSEAICAQNQLDAALAELAKVREERAVLQSQVDNHDVMLQQVRMNVEAHWKAKVREMMEDDATVREDLRSLQRENDALRKTVAMRENLLWDICDKVREFGRE